MYFRHSTAHLLAQALRRLYGKDVHFGVGPAIDVDSTMTLILNIKLLKKTLKILKKK